MSTQKREELINVQSQSDISSGTNGEAKAAASDKDDAAGASGGAAGSPKAKKNKDEGKGAKAFTREELIQHFDECDLDRNGMIEEHEMGLLFDHLGIRFTSASLHSTFAAIDKDCGGSITQDEFVEFFENKDKRAGLRVILEKVNAEKELEHVKKKASIRRMFSKDVYILHGMSPKVGPRRCCWLANVLEFADVRCVNPFGGKEKDKRKTMPANAGMPIEEESPASMDDCVCVVLLLDGQSLVTGAAQRDLAQAKLQGKPILVFYEGELEIWEKMARWRDAVPFAFDRMPVAISRPFLSDSEQMVLHAVHGLLDKEQPLLKNLRPPGGDSDDFSFMRRSGIKWVKASHVCKIQPGATAADLPPDAFDYPRDLRTCYVSYVQENPDVKGLSPAQQAKLQEAINRNLLSKRVFFLDHISLEGKSLLIDTDAAELLAYSRFIILDDIEDSADDRRPYLSRGQCFLEALMCILTGCMAPWRENHFIELDSTLGVELGAGTNLRRFFRERCCNPHTLVNQLCNLVQRKYPCRKDEIVAEWTLRMALERHPLLIQAVVAAAKPPKPAEARFSQ